MLGTLEHRIKSQDSLTRKILSDSHIKGISLEEAAEGIGDSLRYTMIVSEENYANVANKSLQQLQESGYTVNKIKNYWGDDIYQGVNVSLTTPDGVKMELQFHTEDSFYTKEILITPKEILAFKITAFIKVNTKSNIPPT